LSQPVLSGRDHDLSEAKLSRPRRRFHQGGDGADEQCLRSLTLREVKEEVPKARVIWANEFSRLFELPEGEQNSDGRSAGHPAFQHGELMVHEM